VACTLDTDFASKWGQNNQHVNAGCPLFVPDVAYPINTQLGLRGADTSNSSREGVGVGNAGDPAYTLQAGHSHAVAYDHPGRYNNIHGGTGEHRHVMPTLESTNPKQIIAFAQNTRDEVRYINGDGQIVGALAASSGMKQTNYIAFSKGDHGADAGDNICPTIRKGGDGGGNMPAVAYSIMPMNSGKDYKARETEVAQPIMAGGPVSGNQGGDFVVTPFTLIGGVDYENNGHEPWEPTGPIMKGSPTGGGHPLPAIAFDTTQISSPHNYSNPQAGDPCHPLAAGAHPPTVAFEANMSFTTPDTSGVNPTLTRRHYASVAIASAVRRLTPRECERLQGFPDDYTAIPWRKKGSEDCPDGPRYKALGNSMAVPVMRWIGERIAAVEAFNAP
jgi:DNA (cytosine-5)-methyltransferase 1